MKRPPSNRALTDAALDERIQTTYEANYQVYGVMKMWKVLNRLRAIAEHGGMARSTDRRLTTHVVRQTPLARFWMVPYNTGWHLAHHVDMGVPFRNLPRLHQELVDGGWITPDLEYRSYWAFWRACSSRPRTAGGAAGGSSERSDRTSFLDFD